MTLSEQYNIFIVEMRRGLAGMTLEKRKEIARLGGLASWASGKSNRFTSETAKVALKKRKAKYGY